MKSFSIKVPRSSQCSAADFAKLFSRLHTDLQEDIFSFEISAVDQSVVFGFTSSDSGAALLTEALYAVFPEGEIAETKDPAICFSSESNFAAVEFNLHDHDLLPCDSSHENGPLARLLPELSKCIHGERVLLQVIVEPVPQNPVTRIQLSMARRRQSLALHLNPLWLLRSRERKERLEAISGKTHCALFKVKVRLAVREELEGASPLESLNRLAHVFCSTTETAKNKLCPDKTKTGHFTAREIQDREMGASILLSAGELSHLMYIPTERDAPHAARMLARRQPPPPNLPTNLNGFDLSFFGHTNYQNRKLPFGMLRDDRLRHLYILGKSGTGKSKLLAIFIREDLEAGKGIGVLDPHGDLVDEVLRLVPEHRINNVALFDPGDTEFPPALNPLAGVPPAMYARVTSGIVAALKRLCRDSWSASLEHLARYAVLALLEIPGSTLLSLEALLGDGHWRARSLAALNNDAVKQFWLREYPLWLSDERIAIVNGMRHKLGEFLGHPLIRAVVGQPDNRFDFRSFLDHRQILLMKISKGILGEQNAEALGALLLASIYQGAMSRADIPEMKRKNFYLYVDEFHNCATDTVIEILSEARKYRLSLTMAHQFMDQCSDAVQKVLLGNVGSLISFRLGSDDAERLSREMNGKFSAEDLANLSVRDFVVKMSIKGEVAAPFSGRTLSLKLPERHFGEQCREASRAKYSRPLVEARRALSKQEFLDDRAPVRGETKYPETIRINNRDDDRGTSVLPRFFRSNKTRREEPIM